MFRADNPGRFVGTLLGRLIAPHGMRMRRAFDACDGVLPLPSSNSASGIRRFLPAIVVMLALRYSLRHRRELGLARRGSQRRTLLEMQRLNR